MGSGSGEEYEGSGGTAGTTLRDTGLPVVIVTNRGAKTGAVRKTPLMRVEHEGAYAAVGSSGGAPQEPGLGVQPPREPAGGAAGRARDVEMTAREVTGEERAAWWERAVAAYPPYAEYQTEDRPADPGLRARAEPAGPDAVAR